jgi:hypothetical protein
MKRHKGATAGSGVVCDTLAPSETEDGAALSGNAVIVQEPSSADSNVTDWTQTVRDYGSMLASIEISVSKWLQISRGPDPAERRRAVTLLVSGSRSGLALRRSARVRGRLLEMLESDEAAVFAVLVALRRVRDPRANQRLIDILGSHPDLRCRLMAARALGERDGLAVSEALRRFLCQADLSLLDQACVARALVKTLRRALRPVMDAVLHPPARNP